VECGLNEAQATDRDLVEGPGHHGDEHVEEDDDRSPVVDAEHDVAEALGEPALIASTQLHRSRVFQTEHRPVDRAKRVLQTTTASECPTAGNQ